MEKEYYRLPGNRGITFLGRHSLWRGKDHVLSITNRGYSEDYRRFYYTDIQAIYFQKTAGAMIGNILYTLVFAVLAFLALYGWKTQGWEEWGTVTVLVFAGFFLLLLALNIARGATCKAYLRTAVQIQPLPSLSRVRTSIKAIAMLRPLIEAAQGALTVEELNAVPEPVEVPLPPIDPAVPNLRKKPIVHDEGNLHMVLFCVLLLRGLFTAIQIPFQNITLVSLSWLLFLVAIVLVIVALIRQRNTDVPVSVRKAASWAFGFMIVSFIVTYVYSLHSFFTISQIPFAGPDLKRLLVMEKPTESIPLLVLLVFSAIGSLLIGGGGILSVAKMKRDRRSSVSVQ